MNRQTFKQYVGTKGEEAAVEILTGKGFNILKRNYRVHNVGGLDIIAEKGGDIYIFEVRTRLNSGCYPDSVESVAGRKMKKVMKTAMIFVAANDLCYKNLIFEIASVTCDKQGNIQRVDFVPF